MRSGIHTTMTGVTALAVILGAWCEPSLASDLTAALKGVWSGSGKIMLAKGKSEKIRCRGNSRELSANSVEQYFHCASTDKEFDFYMLMHFSEGHARGDWRAPDRSGSLSGSASRHSLRLRLSSSSGEGNLSATIGTCSQSINATGWSNELTSLSVDLRKDC